MSDDLASQWGIHHASGGIPGTTEIQIQSMRLIFAAGVDIQKGGLEQGAALAHLRVVDIPHGEAWLIPLNVMALVSLAMEIRRVLPAGIDTGELEDGSESST